MSRADALRRARRFVYMTPHGRQWVVVFPWNWHDPAGPVTHGHPRDYWACRGECTRSRAAFALRLLHPDADDVAIYCAVDQWRGHLRLDAIVKGAMR